MLSNSECCKMQCLIWLSPHQQNMQWNQEGCSIPMPAVSLGLTISKHEIKYCHSETQKFRRDSLFTKPMCPWDSQFQNPKLKTENMTFDNQAIYRSFRINVLVKLYLSDFKKNIYIIRHQQISQDYYP